MGPRWLEMDIYLKSANRGMGVPVIEVVLQRQRNHRFPELVDVAQDYSGDQQARRKSLLSSQFQKLRCPHAFRKYLASILSDGEDLARSPTADGQVLAV